MLGTNGWFLGSWMAGIHAGSTNLPFLTPGFQLYIGFIPTVTSYETEVLATIAAIVPCHMEVVICTLLFETVSTGVNPSLLTDALLVMSNGVNIDIPNVLHIGSQDSLGRIPIAFTINYSDICGAYPAGDPSGIVHQIGLHNSSFSVEFVQVLLGTILSNIQIPVSGSVNIMFLITVA
jgi:hypothetical protein